MVKGVFASIRFFSYTAASSQFCCEVWNPFSSLVLNPHHYSAMFTYHRAEVLAIRQIFCALHARESVFLALFAHRQQVVLKDVYKTKGGPDAACNGWALAAGARPEYEYGSRE